MTFSRRAALVATMAALVLAATASAAPAADRYLAPNGTDAGACADSAAPCLTFSYAQSAATDGDTVHLAAGTYGAASIGSGMSVNRSLTIEGPQAGVPAPGRTGAEAVLDVTAFSGVIQQLGNTVLTIDGLTLAGTGDGVVAHSVAQTTIANTRIIGSGTRAVTADAVGGTTVEGSTVAAGYSSGLIGLQGLTLTSNVLATGVQAGGSLWASGNTFTSPYATAIGVFTSGAVVTGNRFTGPRAIAALFSDGGAMTATDNWYGCNGGANAPGCATVSGSGMVVVEPHLELVAGVDPAKIAPNATADATATLQSSDGSGVPAVLPVATAPSFSTTFGTLASPTAALGDVNTLTAPATTGDGAVSVTLDSQTVSAPFQVRIPGLTIDPPDAGFGSIVVGGSSATQTFTVSNNSGDPIRIRSVGLQGADADQFTLWANACRTTLADGASCTVSAAMKPTSPGAKEAAIGLVADGIRTPPTIPLAGTATGASTLAVAPSSADFGRVSLGGASSRQNVTLTNTGADPLPITSITTTGSTDEFVVSAGACRATLAPGGTCTLTASFRPLRAGAEAVSVTVRATGQPAQSVTLTGTGVASALTISPASAAFGTGRVGSATKQVFTVTNNGQTEAPISLGSVTLAGDAAYTLYGGGCAKHTLAVGESCEISALLRPTSSGNKAAQITVNASGQPASTISLTGSAS